MAGNWRGSDRGQELPPNWRELCRIIRKRSKGRCEFTLYSGARCPRKADGGVDHIIPGNNHSIENLRDTCQHHHGKKSSQEGHDAKAAIKAQRFRPSEDHPGSRHSGP